MAACTDGALAQTIDHEDNAAFQRAAESLAVYESCWETEEREKRLLAVQLAQSARARHSGSAGIVRMWRKPS